jgi:cytochrome c biogenesis protein CcdA
MLGLLALVVSVGLADSLNPSTVVPALYYATSAHPTRAVAGFTLGVFGVNLAGGLLLVFGPGRALVQLIPSPSAGTQHLLELALGAVALVVAAAVWQRRHRVGERFARAEVSIQRAAPAVGASVAAVELPTALPYFAVVAAIVASRASAPAQLALLVLFNVLFVAPQLVILALTRLHAARGPIEAVRGFLLRHGGALIAGLALVIGIVLLAVGAVGIARHG